MARYYRRRYRTIVRAPKKKWASNIVEVSKEVSSSTGYATRILASNSSETATPTPVVIKTGNFKLQGDYYYNNGTTTMIGHPRATLYIVFIPQGMVPTSSSAAADIIQNHPEWIMAWRLLESSYVANTSVVDANIFSLSSRLKRNLNSGDAIYAIILVGGLSTGQTFTFNGMCQYWTCAN